MCIRDRIKAVHFAWDNPDEDLTGYFQLFLDLTAIKSSRQRRVYVLTNYGSTHEQDLYLSLIHISRTCPMSSGGIGMAGSLTNT